MEHRVDSRLVTGGSPVVGIPTQGGGGAVTLQLAPEGTFRLCWPRDDTVTGEAARSAVAAVDLLSAGRRCPLLVDWRPRRR